MTGGGWPPLDTALSRLTLRAPSVITTIYGDAVLPRGGSLALVDLLALMRRLGATDGMVRTAVSRLARDGVLQGRRHGRLSAYALTGAARVTFAAAVPRIYGPGPDRDGTLHLAFPEPGTERAEFETQGFAVLAPGVMAAPGPVPAGLATVVADGPPSLLRALAARTWPLSRVGSLYQDFLDAFGGMPHGAPDPIDAMAARAAVIHTYRRAVLRDPCLPSALLGQDWPGHTARALCRDLYRGLAAQSELWLDVAGAGPGGMPPGPDPAARFSGGGRPPSAPASLPVRAGSRPRRRSASP